MANTFPIIQLNLNNEIVEFRDKAVIEAEAVQEIHPVGIELPSSTARIRVWLDNTIVDDQGRTIRDKFSPFSDGIYYQSMTTGLIVDIRESMGGVERMVGRFYLQEWRNPKQGELELVCVDAIGTLDNKTYLGNFYELPTPVSTIIADVMKSVDVGYEIEPAVASKQLKGYLPGNKTLRESLQHVLFACGAYAVTAGSDKICIKQGIIPLAKVVETISYYDSASAKYDTTNVLYSDQIVDIFITDDEKTDSQELTIQQLVTAVQISSHDYAKGTIEEEIFSALLTPGDYMVVYPKPYHWVSASGIGDVTTYLGTANGEWLIDPASTDDYILGYTIYGEFEFGVNYVYLHVPAADPMPEVKVVGKPWLDGTQLVEWINPDGVKNYNEGFAYDASNAIYDLSTYRRDWSVYAPPNVWKIDNATLLPFIRTGNEETVNLALARIAEYAKLRYQQNSKLFPRSDVKPGNLAVIDSLYGKDIVGVIERLVSNLSGGYLIDAELVGVERTM
jgi:hypothetical protein